MAFGGQCSAGTEVGDNTNRELSWSITVRLQPTIWACFCAPYGVRLTSRAPKRMTAAGNVVTATQRTCYPTTARWSSTAAAADGPVKVPAFP